MQAFVSCKSIFALTVLIQRAKEINHGWKFQENIHGELAYLTFLLFVTESSVVSPLLQTIKIDWCYP